jgi:hypothetical protein
MAYIVPSDLADLALAGSQSLELQTLKSLKSNLPSDYTVFHGVHWSRGHAKRPILGEIDFIVVNPAGEILVIEQKNGPLEERDGDLIKRYPDRAKSVSTQIVRNMEGLCDRFKDRHKLDLKADYLLYCPEHTLRAVNASVLDPGRIVDAADQLGLEARISEHLDVNGVDDNNGYADLVLRFLEQAFDLKPSIHAHIKAQERAMIRMGSELTDLVDRLSMIPYRLRLQAVAGAGKSHVAAHYYETTKSGGGRPLLVCFSRPLRERLRGVLGQNEAVYTWHGLIDSFLKSKGHCIDYSQQSVDPNFWRDISERILNEAVPDEWRFDTLIVDEGQDFEDNWLEMLEIFLAEEHNLLWLDDPDQNIYDRATIEPPIGTRYQYDINYRTPESIARFVKRNFPFQFETGAELPGLGTGITRWTKASDQPRLASKIISQLRTMGFGYDDIVVLTTRGIQNSTLSPLDRLGPHRLRRFSGDYDMFGNQVYSDGQLLFESVYRFKGQQAPAVLLVDVDPKPDHERDMRVLYTAMTRATVRLEILCNAENNITKSWQI